MPTSPLINNQQINVDDSVCRTTPLSMERDFLSKIPDSIIQEELLGRTLSVFSEFIANDHQFDALSADTLGPGQNLKSILEKKLIHTVAALNYMQLVMQGETADFQLPDWVLSSVLLFELTQVDLADSLGEHHLLRSPTAQIKLFTGLHMAATRGKEKQLFDRGVKSEEMDMLLLWEDFLNRQCLTFYGRVRSMSNWESFLPYIDRRLQEYYTMIAIGHVQDSSERMKLVKDLYRATTISTDVWKKTPNWLIDPELWIPFHGDSISFLAPIGFLEHRGVNELFVKKLIIAFRCVGLFNVLLDDYIDLEEDKNNKDSNICASVITGSFSEDISKLGDEFDIEGEDNIDTLMRGLIHQIYVDFQKVYIPKQSIDLFRRHLLIIPEMLKLYLCMAQQSNVSEEIINRVGNLYAYSKETFGLE